MSLLKPRALPELSEYEQNRMLISDEVWQLYTNMWVGLSFDGRQIIAGAPDLIQLDEKLRSAGESIGNVALEFVPSENDLIGGQAEVI